MNRLHYLDRQHMIHVRTRLGKNLRERRNEIPLGRREAARMLRVLSKSNLNHQDGPTYISRVERGVENASLSRYLLLSDIFGMTPAELFDGVKSLTEWLEECSPTA